MTRVTSSTALHAAFTHHYPYIYIKAAAAGPSPRMQHHDLIWLYRVPAAGIRPPPGLLEHTPVSLRLCEHQGVCVHQGVFVCCTVY